MLPLWVHVLMITFVFGYVLLFPDDEWIERIGFFKRRKIRVRRLYFLLFYFLTVIFVVSACGGSDETAGSDGDRFYEGTMQIKAEDDKDYHRVEFKDPADGYTVLVWGRWYLHNTVNDDEDCVLTIFVKRGVTYASIVNKKTGNSTERELRMKGGRYYDINDDSGLNFVAADYKLHIYDDNGDWAVNNDFTIEYVQFEADEAEI